MMRGKPNGFDHGVVPILSPQLLSMEDWRDATIPEPDFLLSEVFSTTSRGLLAAPTGLGKTMFGMALGLAIATGNNFLHWQGRRPAKVLYVDGEMSQRLMKRRIDDT